MKVVLNSRHENPSLIAKPIAEKLEYYARICRIIKDQNKVQQLNDQRNPFKEESIKTVYIAHRSTQKSRNSKVNYNSVKPYGMHE